MTAHIQVPRPILGPTPTPNPYVNINAPIKPTFTEGMKFDADKCRLELFPGDALVAIAWVLTYGAKKYTARNWEKGISWGRVYGALMRHLWAWWQGKAPTKESFLFGEVDGDTQFSHLWHAGCCIIFLITYEARGMKEFDDRPKGGGD